MEMSLFEQIVQLKPLMAVIFAYFIGSIPTSIIIGKLFFKTDIRNSGSGNTGATNALRTLGVKAGVIVLLIDVFKGVAAVMLAKALMHTYNADVSLDLVVALSALMAILGHIFSVFLKFKGGKGVATAAGVFATLMPMSFFMCLVLFLFIVSITHYVSLGSILSAGTFFLMELISQYLIEFPKPYQLALTGIVVALIIFRHKANISRLLHGNENKFSLKKKEKPEIEQ